MKIFRKENILPLIGLALTLFGLVMLIIAGDWANVVWPVAVLFLIFKWFKNTDLYLKLQEEFKTLQEVAIDAKSELEKKKNVWTMYQVLLEKFKEMTKLHEDASLKLNEVTKELDTLKSQVPVMAAPQKKRQSKKRLSEIKKEVNVVQEDLK